MAALLVSLGVMMLLMSVALPVWRHQAQREREAELVFRGQQYARAVNLYTRKAGPGNFPPSVDILVQQRFLRKKFKDPMTKDGEFDIITAATAGQATTPQLGGRGSATPGRNSMPTTGVNVPSPSSFSSGRGQNLGGQTATSPFAGGQQGATGGGIMGVRSKSKETSIRLYNGATHYNEWSFLFSNVSNRPGITGNGTADGRGGNRGGGNRPTFPGGGGPGGAGGFGGAGGGVGGGRNPGAPGSNSIPGPFQPGRRGGG